MGEDDDDEEEEEEEKEEVRQRGGGEKSLNNEGVQPLPCFYIIHPTFCPLFPLFPAAIPSQLSILDLR